MAFNCKVCTASVPNDHAHYGAIVCHSCRLFFRRFCDQDPPCKSGLKSCSIILQARTKCKSCRLQKCFEVGMDSDLVNKTKKSIALYYAHQDAKSVCNDQLKASDEIIVECNQEDKIETANKTGELSASESSEGSPMSSGDEIVEMFHDKPDESEIKEIPNWEVLPANVCSFNRLSVEDVKFFQESMHHFRTLLLKSMFLIGNDPEYMRECGNFVDAVSDPTTKPVASIFKFFELEDKLIFSEHSKYVENVTKISDPKALQKITVHFKMENDLFGIFQSAFTGQKTARQQMTEIGINADQLACLSTGLQRFMDDKYPNILTTTTDFQSPWAASEDLENFFLKTAKKFSFSSDPVASMIFSQLLLLSSTVR